MQFQNLTTLKNNMRKIFGYVGLIIILLSSCTDKSIVFEDNIAFEKEVWNRETPRKFNFEVSDTSSLYEVSYIIRNVHDYPYCNLYLKYNIKDKNDSIVSSNFQEILLYNPKNGDPLGKTEMLNDVQTGVYPFAKTKFKTTGKYTLSVTHQMRESESLNGLESIGIQIKKLL